MRDYYIEGEAILEFVTKYSLLALMTALPATPSFMDYEAVYLAKIMSFQQEYAKSYDWIAQQLKDWAFMLTTSILYCHDYDSIDESTWSLYRKTMAAFGRIAPSYHIELLEKPTIY